MKCDVDGAGEKQEKVDGQVGAGCLQRSAVQHIGLTLKTNCCNFQVSERHAADGGDQQDHLVGQATDVVDEDTFAGQLEQGGIVTEGVYHNPPAAR